MQLFEIAKNTCRWSAFFLGAVLYSTTQCAVGADSVETIAATVAPNFVLKNSNGKNIRLRELHGQVVMINFWATWCGPCREEMPKLEQLYRQYREVGFTLIGINIDDNTDSAIGFSKKLNVTFPILFDKDKQVSKLYKVDAMPSSILIDRDGKLRYLHRGYKPGYEISYQSEVRALLKE